MDIDRLGGGLPPEFLEASPDLPNAAEPTAGSPRMLLDSSLISATPMPLPGPDLASATPMPLPGPDLASATPIPIPGPDLASATPIPIPSPGLAGVTPMPLPGPDRIQDLPGPRSEPAGPMAILGSTLSDRFLEARPVAESLKSRLHDLAQHLETGRAESDSGQEVFSETAHERGAGPVPGDPGGTGRTRSDEDDEHEETVQA